MSTARRKIEARIKKKEQEIQQLEEKIESIRAQLLNLGGEIREAEAALTAFQESLDFIPEGEGGTPKLRAGTRLAKAREAIRAAGQPLHIMALLEAMGLEPSANNRASVAGSLSHYVRRGEIFTRPLANTFGLKDEAALGADSAQAEDDEAEGVP